MKNLNPFTRFLLFTGKSLFTAMLVLLFSTNLLFAQTATAPSAGDGTSGSPYQVATLENLYWITASDAVVLSPTQATRWTKYYIQTADINATATSGWFSGAGWLPIATVATSFTGYYNGQGHTIDGLFINNTSLQYLGLFAVVTTPSIISNLGVTNVNITGGADNGSVGSLTGNNSGTISKCYSTGSVTGMITSVGGLTGANYGTIDQSYSKATVTGRTDYGVGGLAGQHRNGATITNCYSTGNVIRASGAGGTNTSFGGLVGWIGFSTNTINYSYSVGRVTYTGATNPTDKGFLGYQNADGTYIYTNNFWDKETSYQTSTAGAASNSATGKTTVEMKTQSTFTGWDFATTPVWHISSNNSGYPHLAWQVFVPIVSSLEATGTGIKWYSAATEGSLYNGSEALVNGQIYYASQTVNGCESATRFPVTAVINALPAAPAAGTHTPSPTEVIWNWSAVSGATGYKWGTTNDYAVATNMNAALTKTETGLTCNTAYNRYVWSYNSCGNSTPVSLTQTTSACLSLCGSSIVINHIAGEVAPVTKTVTYGIVTNIPGETTKCWITSNLGSDHQATAVSDATEPSAGWYWQFNLKQGYQYTTTRLPNTAWITSITENSDWLTVNDPCAIELGTGWRIPTYTEWNNVITEGSWTNWNGPWNSGLKMHAAGYLSYLNGSLGDRGISGNYWSSTQHSQYYDMGIYLGFGGWVSVGGSYKVYGFSVRCVRTLPAP